MLAKFAHIDFAEPGLAVNCVETHFMRAVLKVRTNKTNRADALDSNHMISKFSNDEVANNRQTGINRRLVTNDDPTVIVDAGWIHDRK